MRRLALLPVVLAASACLAAPTGIDPTAVDAAVDGAGTQAWPPSGADLRAIAGGDVTGDAVDDLVVVDVGRMRVYLLVGGTDFATGTSRTATSYSLEAAISGLRAPVAVTITPDRRIVVLDNPPSGARLTMLDASLAITGTTPVSATPAASTDAIWLRSAPFGMSMSSVFAAVPTAVGFVEQSDLGLASPVFKLLNDRTFTAPVLAGGYRIGPTPFVYVAEPTRAHKAEVNQMAFSWTTPRDAGPWLAQTVADIGGDGAPEIIGLDVVGTGSRVCAVDIGAGAVPTCHGTPYGMDSNVVIEVAEVNTANQDDLVMLHPSMGMASVFILPNLRVTAGAVAADPPANPTMRPIVNPMMAILQVVAGGAKEILLVGSDGAMACLRATGALAVDC